MSNRMNTIAIFLCISGTLFAADTKGFIVSMTERVEREGETKPVADRSILYLGYADGSYVLSQKTRTPHSKSGWFEVRVTHNVRTGQDVESYPEVEAKMTVPAFQPATAVPAPAGLCKQPPEFGRQSERDIVLDGFALQAYSAEYPREGGKVAVTRWIAPELRCLLVQQHASLYKDGTLKSKTSKDALSIVRADPPDQALDVPLGLVETKPSEVMAKMQAFEGKTCSECLLSVGNNADRRYESRRSGK